ncbi:hypothetical protein GQ457_11G002580 [Hibiscus cannabinus]
MRAIWTKLATGRRYPSETCNSSSRRSNRRGTEVAEKLNDSSRKSESVINQIRNCGSGRGTASGSTVANDTM